MKSRSQHPETPSPKPSPEDGGGGFATSRESQTGAGFSKSSESQTLPVSNQQSLPIVPGSSHERFHQAFQHDLRREDPRVDGWNTETFSDLASIQLKALEKLIASSDVNPQKLQPLITPDFQCGPLRSRSLETAFRDRTIHVLRAQGDNDESFAGAAGFAKAIDALKSDLDATHLHVHFKTIRVQLRGDHEETTSYFELGGETKSGGVQQTATWICRWNWESTESVPLLESILVQDFEEVVTRNALGPLFQDCTEAVLGRNPSFNNQLLHGIDHWIRIIDRRLGLDIVATHGLAVGDVDGDGLDDVYVCEPGGLPNRMFLHKPDGTARDVSAVSGVDYMESTRSALLVDLDNDGDQDMVIACDRFIVFMSNDGYGRFNQRAGFRTTASIVSLASADYDLDGRLDIYACGYFTMEDAAEATIGLGNPIPFHDANNGARNALFRNEGNWVFRDVTEQVGLDQDNSRFSLAAAWEDYDKDGDPDLYVANDYGRNCLYRNDDGRFTNVAAKAGVEDISAGMSVSWGDYNRDGLMDIYVSNMFSSAGNRISYQRQFKDAAEQSVREHYQRFARGNTLFENAGDGTFRDVTLATGVTMGRWAWASHFVDINNDGWQDLLVANGMLTREHDTGDL